jgi:hypothetical protein
MKKGGCVKESDNQGTEATNMGINNIRVIGDILNQKKLTGQHRDFYNNI